MRTINTPFRLRAEKVIRQAVNQRLFLIRTGKSKNGVETHHCEKIIQDIELLRNDSQYAKYLTENFALLEKVKPGPHKDSKVPLNDLLTEAPQYIRP